MTDGAGAREHGWTDPGAGAREHGWRTRGRARSRILRQAGYHVLEAADGDAVLALARSESRSLVILDTAMPGVDGSEPCRRLRAHPATSLTRVVHVTGSPERAPRLAAIEAIEASSHELLPGPSDAERLRVRTRSLLRHRHLSEHLVSAEAWPARASSRGPTGSRVGVETDPRE